MFDSVNLAEIPKDAPAVAGYVGGMWPTFPHLKTSFPHAHRLSIAVNASQDADCLDVELGDATPEQAPAWVSRQLKRGVKRPVVYCSVAGAEGVLGALSRAGIRRSAIRLWTAHYTGRPHRCSPHCGYGFLTFADATQWTNHSHGRNLDESLCAPGFFHVPLLKRIAKHVKAVIRRPRFGRI